MTIVAMVVFEIIPQSDDSNGKTHTEKEQENKIWKNGTTPEL